MFAKRGLARLAASAAFSGLVALLERLGDRRTNLLRVLTYHRVDEPQRRPDLWPGLISATPPRFEEQMDLLAARCRVVSLEQVVDAIHGGRPLPPRSVLITFDDAYRDFAENAWPVLKRHGLPAVLFVPTAFPDQPERAFWWDRLHQALAAVSGGVVSGEWSDAARLLTTHHSPLTTHAPSLTTAERERAYRGLTDYVKSLPHAEAEEFVNRTCDELGACRAANHVLSWRELKQLASEGLTLAAHTRTHPLMTRISPDEVREEAIGSLRDLEREVGPTPPVLAWPGGAVDDTAAAVLAEAGFRLAFSTRRGVNDLASADRLRLRRINVGRRTTPALLRAQLLPCVRHGNRWLR